MVVWRQRVNLKARIKIPQKSVPAGILILYITIFNYMLQYYSVSNSNAILIIVGAVAVCHAAKAPTHRNDVNH